MKILITNDDGISAVGIKLLAEWAKTLCGGNNEITVVAPKVEQSGMSHAIDFIHPVEIKQVPLTDGVRAYSMDSTPADCVRFGVLGLLQTYDLEALRKERLSWGLFRDRRPECYKDITR